MLAEANVAPWINLPGWFLTKEVPSFQKLDLFSEKRRKFDCFALFIRFDMSIAHKYALLLDSRSFGKDRIVKSAKLPCSLLAPSGALVVIMG